MAMEHRWQKRNNSSAEVDVYKQGECLGRAQVVDMNSGGMGLTFVPNLSVGEVVIVEFPDDGRCARCFVVYVEGRRCGLMFLSWLTRSDQLAVSGESARGHGLF